MLENAGIGGKGEATALSVVHGEDGVEFAKGDVVEDVVLIEHGFQKLKGILDGEKGYCLGFQIDAHRLHGIVHGFVLVEMLLGGLLEQLHFGFLVGVDYKIVIIFI